jgi:hypothetical protein
LWTIVGATARAINRFAPIHRIVFFAAASARRMRTDSVTPEPI